MTDDIDPQQDREWAVLHERITEVLELHRREHGAGENDYYLDNDNVGHYRRRIETERPELVMPDVVKSLQTLLTQYPSWEIVIAFGASGGVVIRDDEIIDGLERQHLPKELQAIEYEGARPLGSRFGDIMYSGLTVGSAGFSVHIPEDSSLSKLMKK
jgi:hypothetical protein